MENVIKEINILLVDDRPENLFTLEELLSDKIRNVNYVKCSSGQEALRKTLEMEVALLLLDVQMPEMDGFEVARLLKKNNRTRNIPIIFLTAINKEDHYVEQGYETGAIDYLSKPFNPVILVSKVKSFVDMYTLQKRLNESNSKLEKFADLLSEKVSDSIITIKICASDLKEKNSSPSDEQKLNIIIASADKVKEAIRQIQEGAKIPK